MTRADEDIQEFIDTRGFFVRRGRQRRAALLPVAPSSPEVDVGVAGHVIEEAEPQERGRRRRAAEGTGDENKVCGVHSSCEP